MAQRVCPICKKEISRGWAITNDGKLFFHKSCHKNYVDECTRKIFSVAKEREKEDEE